MKKYLIPLTVCLLVASPGNISSAQELHFPNEYFIWAGAVPGDVPADYPQEKWTEGEESEFGLVQNVTHPTIRVFLPEKELNTGAAVVICPGGGYNILVIEREGYKIAQAFNKLGIAAIVLKYRHYDRDIAVQDARQAIRFVRAHAEEWKIDPGKVGIGGFSAGGHLSLNTVLAEDPDERPVVPGDLLYKYPYKPDFLMLIYPGLGRLNMEPEQFGEGFPPVFMINAIDDDVTPVTHLFELAEILKATKVPTEIHVYPGGSHGFDLGNKDCNCSDWPELFRKWLIHNKFINS